jgi:hypothetical protein
MILVSTGVLGVIVDKWGFFDQLCMNHHDTKR